MKITEDTVLIKIHQDNETKDYPISLQQARIDNPDWSFPAEPDETFINMLGYQVVNPTNKPTTDEGVVVEDHPILIDGKWIQTWTIRTYTEEEEQELFNADRDNLLYQLSFKINKALETGFEYQFDDGVGHVQLRDGDRANITAARIRAEVMINGEETKQIPYRDLENNIHMCSPETIIDLSDKAYDAYLAILAIGWQVKDQIDSATDRSQLPEIPDEIVIPG